MNTVEWAGCLGRYNWPEVERPNRTANGLVHYYSTESLESPTSRGHNNGPAAHLRAGGPVHFKAASVRCSTEVTSGQPRPVVQEGAGDQEITLLRQGPVRESGVAAILVHEEVGAAGSGCCPKQLWTRMLLLLHGHMRRSIRREICDFLKILKAEK